MTFKKEACNDFIALFDHYKDQIRNTDGCLYLEMLRDRPDGNVFFTYSHWHKADDLENYRSSAIFAEVWPRTKVLFEKAAEAWTAERLYQLK